jgi:hypothetical protein
MRGAMMPVAPPSSTRPIAPYSRSGIRTNGASPMSTAQEQIWAAASSGIALCSRSTQIMSWPVVLAMRAISPVRELRTPSARTGRPCASRSMIAFMDVFRARALAGASARNCLSPA